MKKSIISFIFIMLTFFSIYVLKANECWAGASNKECSQGQVCISNPLQVDTPEAFIGQIIRGILGIVGSLALIMFIYGGLIWMTAAGSSDKVEKGKGILVWATIGLIVIFTSYALVNFVISDLVGAPTTTQVDETK